MAEIVAALAYHRVEPSERVRILEVLAAMPFAQELYEDLRREAMKQGLEQGLQQGLRQGLQQGLREAVLRAFSIRFDEVPGAVRQAVERTEDPEQLDQWLTQVIRATDAAAARRALTGED